MTQKVIRGLKRVDGSEITNLNANWETRPIPMSEFLNIGIQLGWDNILVEGVLTFQYSCDPKGDGSDVLIWTDKATVTLDGTFAEVLFLDALLPVGNIRLVFVHTSGAAELTAYTVRK
jgi:hypothetical protein